MTFSNSYRAPDDRLDPVVATALSLFEALEKKKKKEQEQDQSDGCACQSVPIDRGSSVVGSSCTSTHRSSMRDKAV